MSTIDHLISSGELTVIEVGLEDAELAHRTLLGTKRFIEWLSGTLPTLPEVDGYGTPAQEQVAAIFADFILGEPLSVDIRFHALKPEKDGVWELKTYSIRIFGWFHAKDCFIADAGGVADWIKDNKAYGPYRDQTIRTRKAMQLEASAVFGVRYEDVLSDAG